MKPWHKHKMTRNLLAVSLASLSACAPVTGGGAFCDVVSAPIVFDPEVAAVVVTNDRPAAVRLDAQNRYWEGNCQ